MIITRLMLFRVILPKNFLYNTTCGFNNKQGRRELVLGKPPQIVLMKVGRYDLYFFRPKSIANSTPALVSPKLLTYARNKDIEGN